MASPGGASRRMDRYKFMSPSLSIDRSDRPDGSAASSGRKGAIGNCVPAAASIWRRAQSDSAQADVPTAPSSSATCITEAAAIRLPSHGPVGCSSGAGHVPVTGPGCTGGAGGSVGTGPTIGGTLPPGGSSGIGC